MKITQKEIELVSEYKPSEGVTESNGIFFTDEMIIDFAKQYHLKKVNVALSSVSNTECQQCKVTKPNNGWIYCTKCQNS